ncbi:MAG: tRNA pseudouridine(55) synthase TruB [Planctomycetaceae bacterium]|nr:tRNA pseudouridine(55) synthase TruB [Planctomycetaceae bacterium]
MFGVLNVHKPEGVTSRDVVNSVQRITRQIVKPLKLGHAGTLDPMATGVLLVCLGKATRLISILQASPKTYVAEFTLGQTSNTDDSTGEVQESASSSGEIARARIEAALQSFVGTIQQVPPQFSAVKVDGRRAYAKARQGERMQLRAKTVQVYRIDILYYEWPRLSLSIECGSGTYIRSIARDLGELLGCGGLMSALQRTRIGQFDVLSAVEPDDITVDSLPALITNPVQVIGHLPQYRCRADDVALLHNGKTIAMVTELLSADGGVAVGDEVALLSSDGQTLLALGQLQPEGVLQPRQVYCRD